MSNIYIHSDHICVFFVEKALKTFISLKAKATNSLEVIRENNAQVYPLILCVCHTIIYIHHRMRPSIFILKTT